MRALDILIDFLSEQKMSEKIYITKELLNELDYFDHRDLILEELNKFNAYQLEEARSYIDEMLENQRVVQRSDEIGTSL